MMLDEKENKNIMNESYSSIESESEKETEQKEIEKKCSRVLELIHQNVKIKRKLQKKIVLI